MRARVVKQESKDFLKLTLGMYLDRVELYLDKRVCLKCDICTVVCPQEAVRILAGKAELDITIDPRRCLLCEICAHFCPVQAVRLSINGRVKEIFLQHQGLAPFYPKLEIDYGKCPEQCPEGSAGALHWCRQQLRLIADTAAECPKNCRRCLDACPRQVFSWDEVENHNIPQVDACLRCSQCLKTCEFGAIQVNPQFRGRVIIAAEKCPPDCDKCINLCPVKAIRREGDRVVWQVETCALCGTCLNICDQEAITLVREEVVALPGDYSPSWHQAVTKLAPGQEAAEAAEIGGPDNLLDNQYGYL